MLPAGVLLVACTMGLVASGLSSAPRAFGVMALCTPVADILVINRDLAIDPGSHSLMGVEVVYAAVLALALVVPGLVLGLMLRAWLRRRGPA